VDRLVLVGLGPREQYDETRARALAEQLVHIAVGLGARTVLIALPTHGRDRTLTEVAFASLLATIEEREHEMSATPNAGEPEPSETVPTEPAPASQPVRWWVAADEAVVARLRRVLSGPPRATRGGAGLHT
jgi:hypothetical protein